MQHLLRNSWGRVTLEHTIENIVDTEKEYGYFIIPNSIIHYDWNYGGSGAYIPGYYGKWQNMSNSVIKEMIVYKKAYDLGMKIFKITKSFPPDEVYALTSQIRRSSRSVYLNLREAWAKRRYKKNFISKLTECDGENNETDSSLDTAKDCPQSAGFLTTNSPTPKLIGAPTKPARSILLLISLTGKSTRR
jgi:four helix bundle protein